jgi:hypothetical protein
LFEFHQKSRITPHPFRGGLKYPYKKQVYKSVLKYKTKTNKKTVGGLEQWGDSCLKSDPSPLRFRARVRVGLSDQGYSTWEEEGKTQTKTQARQEG